MDRWFWANLYWAGERSIRAAQTRLLEAVNGRPEGYELVIILSHMRAGSSLLTHLLASNPEILGYGELHCAIRDRHYYDWVVTKNFQARRKWRFGGRYLLDKILHNDLTPDSRLVARLRARFLFLVRHPGEALASISKLSFFEGKTDGEVARYYRGRLAVLADLAETIGDPKRSMMLTYDDLVSRTDETLGSISRFLELKDGLASSYRRFETTGMPGVGDPSEKILAGRVLRRDPLSGEGACPFDENAEAFAASAARIRLQCRGVSGLLESTVAPFLPGCRTGVIAS